MSDNNFYTFNEKMNIEKDYGSIYAVAGFFGGNSENMLNYISEAKNLINTILALDNDYLCTEQEIMTYVNSNHRDWFKNFKFDTFYHEHPRTYSAQSFVHIAKKLNAEVRFLDFPHRYGGNIRVFISKDVSHSDKLNLESILSQEKNYVAEFQDMTKFIELWRARKRAQVDQLVSEHGPLPAKAFPGRAAILIKLLNLDSTEILTVYEKPGSPKIGHYVPGTRIPISSDAEANFAKLKVPIINLAWHISAEIHQYLHSVGLQTEIIEILELDPV
jgi:hypothetical protein